MTTISDDFLINLPRDLLFDGLFCGWKLLEGKGKVPYNPKTHLPVKSNDSSTFLSFFEIKGYLNSIVKKEDNKLVSGIGFGIFNGYSAVDIDHCVDENGCISEFAMEIIDFFKSYTEFSPSGTGIHIIFKNAQPFYDANKYYIRNDKLEIYVSGATKKYLTLSANKFKYDTIETVNISEILDKYMLRPNQNNADGNLTAILQKDIKFAELWNSVASGSGGNESETDLALLNKLMFYTKCDKEKAKALFEMSPFFASKDEEHKKKWNNGYYAEHTLEVSYSSVRQNIINRNMLSADTLVKYTEKKDTNGNFSIDEAVYIEKYTDKYFAKIFEQEFANSYRYNVDNKKWMYFNGKYWQYDIEKRICKDIIYVARVLENYIDNKSNAEPEKNEAKKAVKYVLSSKGGKNIIEELQTLMPISNSDLDKNPFLLSTDDGYYDLMNDTLEEFDYSKYVSNTTNQKISFEEPTLWINFLNQIFENNQEQINYVHKALGYSLTESSREQCLFVLYGDGNNGKSLLLSVINYVLGSYAISTAATTILKDRWGSSTNTEGIARMKGKRFCVIQEPEMDQYFDESKIKTLTSGNDEQTARHLYGNSFNFVFRGKMWLGANYVPKIKGIDVGIKRRIRIIKLNVDFTGKEDKDLQYKLLEEAPKILGWLINGYKLYKAEGLKETMSMEDNREEYFYSNDVVERWIDTECDTSFPECESNASDLFRHFKMWAKDNEGRDYTQTTFGRQMAKKFVKEKSKRTGSIVYIGVRVKNPTPNQKTEEERKVYQKVDLFDVKV